MLQVCYMAYYNVYSVNLQARTAERHAVEADWTVDLEADCSVHLFFMESLLEVYDSGLDFEQTPRCTLIKGLILQQTGESAI